MQFSNTRKGIERERRAEGRVGGAGLIPVRELKVVRVIPSRYLNRFTLIPVRELKVISRVGGRLSPLLSNTRKGIESLQPRRGGGVGQPSS